MRAPGIRHFAFVSQIRTIPPLAARPAERRPMAQASGRAQSGVTGVAVNCPHRVPHSGRVGHGREIPGLNRGERILEVGEGSGRTARDGVLEVGSDSQAWNLALFYRLCGNAIAQLPRIVTPGTRSLRFQPTPESNQTGDLIGASRGGNRGGI
jgi:hypothetical protein